jgi:hypothetical protein
MMMTKTTITLAAALFFAVGTAAQANDTSPDNRERQGSGWSSHTGPLGQPVGDQQPNPWWTDQSPIYGSVPRHEHIRHHRPVR